VKVACGPHWDLVDPIVAASSDAVRRELVNLTESADFRILALAGEPTELAALLRPESGSWVVTGGSLAQAHPFLSTARSAKAAAVAILTGPTQSDDRAILSYGGLALLRAMPQMRTFQAAVSASRAHLSVWDPGLDALAEPAESIKAPLSPRERTVLQLTGAGLSTKAVARTLDISPNTVKFHLHSTFAKLGVSSRAEAVMEAIRRGELAV